MAKMSKRTMLRDLKEARECMAQSVAYDQEHVDAMDEAIKALDNASDRAVATGILLLSGVVLGAVAMVSALCGLIYVWSGSLEAAGAMLPYVVFPEALAVVALWIAER